MTFKGDVLWTACEPNATMGRERWWQHRVPAYYIWQSIVAQEGLEEPGLLSEAYQALVIALAVKESFSQMAYEGRFLF